MSTAFLSNPMLNVGFTADVDADTALAYASSFLAPGSPFPPDEFVADILATDGAARTGLLASIDAGRFADEVAIVGGLSRPIAILHGAAEQLVSLDYRRGLTVPTLWRGTVAVLPGAGHAPHVETPDEFRRHPHPIRERTRLTCARSAARSWFWVEPTSIGAVSWGRPGGRSSTSV